MELKNATSGTGVVVDNSGLIKSTADRGLDASGSNPARTYQIINREGATLDAAKQAIRISGDLAGTRVSIDNAGTVISQTDRAIMLKDLKTNVQIDITNRATGLIRGVREDAMRVGNNATITNYGTISSGDMTSADAKFDGIDFDASTGGKVENHGTITGGRHGITTDAGAELVNYAGGVIIGRNGSGFGSDGNGRVTNYGRITGAYNGLVPDGDGDGVDIDGQGWIDNHGIIEGTGAGGSKDGSPNTSEGIAMGGGTILNHAGATISGAANAILIDDSATGGAPYATHLENFGQILGLGGDAVRIIGEQADSVINGGLISSTGGVALDLGGGADSLTLRSGSRFVGRVDGGAGRDVLTLNDVGGGSFGNSTRFEWLQVSAGRWTLDTDDFSEGGQVLAGAELVNLGRIGGTLGIASGATYAGGGHVDNLDLAAGSTLAFAVAADGSHSPLQADGRVSLDGARLDVRASAGTYPNTSRYQVIQAADGVSGRFASVTSTFAFLTPSLRYGANSVELELTRNDVAFASVAGNSNAATVAGSISAQGSPQLYNAWWCRTAPAPGRPSTSWPPPATPASPAAAWPVPARSPAPCSAHCKASGPAAPAGCSAPARWKTGRNWRPSACLKRHATSTTPPPKAACGCRAWAATAAWTARPAAPTWTAIPGGGARRRLGPRRPVAPRRTGRLLTHPAGCRAQPEGRCGQPAPGPLRPAPGRPAVPAPGRRLQPA